MNPYRNILAALMLPIICDGLSSAYAQEDRLIRVGSKSFTESVILGEILTQLVQSAGIEAEHRKDLGGTPVLWNALKRGDIDAYVEYTGTLHQETFSGRRLANDAELRQMLRDEFQIVMSEPLGLNNMYALGMLQTIDAPRNGITPEEWEKIRTISDLKKYPGLKFGFSNEFTERGDGWPALKAAYNLPQQDVRGLQHDLAYRGLESGAIDVIDLYSTDADIEYYHLKVLKDDRKFFPDYQAVILYREDLTARAPKAVDAMLKVVGKIDDETIIRLNVEAKIQKIPERQVAKDFLRREFGITSEIVVKSWIERVLGYTWEHLFLVGISVGAAVLLAIPLGVWAAKNAIAGQIVLGVTSILQTIPSLVLFVLLIPLFGLGQWPAICALFLYSLLPIVRNTYTGLQSISPSVHESALALGLPPLARLWQIELPLASRSILAGIKIAAVINVGTATLGGLIGAGGYGTPIFAGIRKDSTSLMLEGAIPAALMALLVQGIFEFSERWLVPAGLRISSEN